MIIKYNKLFKNCKLKTFLIDYFLEYLSMMKNSPDKSSGERKYELRTRTRAGAGRAVSRGTIYFCKRRTPFF